MDKLEKLLPIRSTPSEGAAEQSALPDLPSRWNEEHPRYFNYLTYVSEHKHYRPLRNSQQPRESKYLASDVRSVVVEAELEAAQFEYQLSNDIYFYVPDSFDRADQPPAHSHPSEENGCRPEVPLVSGDLASSLAAW